MILSRKVAPVPPPQKKKKKVIFFFFCGGGVVNYMELIPDIILKAVIVIFGKNLLTRSPKSVFFKQKKQFSSENDYKLFLKKLIDYFTNIRCFVKESRCQDIIMKVGCNQSSLKPNGVKNFDTWATSFSDSVHRTIDSVRWTPKFLPLTLCWDSYNTVSKRFRTVSDQLLLSVRIWTPFDFRELWL